jgi:hypothetical protein
VNLFEARGDQLIASQTQRKKGGNPLCSTTSKLQEITMIKRLSLFALATVAALTTAALSPASANPSGGGRPGAHFGHFGGGHWAGRHWDSHRWAGRYWGGPVYSAGYYGGGTDYTPADSSNCLSKGYLTDGSVVFTDRCTNESAIAQPADNAPQREEGPLK